MLSVLNSKDKLTPEYASAAYSNLGAVNNNLGIYEKALDYYDRAESLINDEHQYAVQLADIYINKAIILGKLKSYISAIDYFEKGIRVYLNPDYKKFNLYLRLSSAYLNLGVTYYETNDYNSAFKYLYKSASIKLKNNIPGIAIVNENIAKTFAKTGNSKKAEEFYLKSISSFIKDSGAKYYRLADVYFDYSLFLRSVGRNEESLELLIKALSICNHNYGEKHTIVSLSYKLIGDHYKIISDYPTALMYYQKSLIAVVKNFNNTDIYTNPSIDSSLFDIRLLDNLKSKATALELYAGEQKDPAVKTKAMSKSLETIELALQLIDKIRNNYMTEESRIYLAENEKETYLFATHLAYSIYSATREDPMGIRMYSIAQKAKAAILRNEITGNELLYSPGIPDSLREKQNQLTGNIAAYNNLIADENRKALPDSNKIALWKDDLFDMNREKEKVTGEMEKIFPQYHDLLRKTEPLTLHLVQKQLKSDETIVDYLLSNIYSDGKRRLYVFLISRDHLDVRELWLDSLFVKNAELIRNTVNPSVTASRGNNNYTGYTGALNYMYNNLIKPVEGLFKGKNLIIIPDEEIGWLPFDAFLKTRPSPGQNDYEGLSYLINEYTFSYAYSSSLISGKNNYAIRRTKVLAFSPEYQGTSLTGKTNSQLQGAGDEIGSIHKWFSGDSYSGELATKANFLSALLNPAIFHLAMHSMSDSVNSQYSYLMFDSHNISRNNARLYNYEISLTRINSPMVVLSACNSGTGTLYYGEGLMSLARSFTLAGASSVIKTAWEINDESSAEIMTNFYRYLSMGKMKNEAMRLSKLRYLENSPPAFKNPYYWAAYEVLGDNGPVTRDNKRYLIYAGFVILIAGTAIFYLSRRRIFSDRSR
jgi:CHAT domain-containing protein